MARSKHNNATYGMSGQVNQFVYIQRFGETLVSKPPVKTARPSAAQRNVTATFKQAARYAKRILKDAAFALAYKKKAPRGKSAFNLAVADYFKAPEILSINMSELTGLPGGKISADVIDNFRVETVTVKIEDSNGNLIEEGAAILDSDELFWVYTTTVAGANATGNIVSIIASDLPGNTILEQKTI